MASANNDHMKVGTAQQDAAVSFYFTAMPSPQYTINYPTQTLIIMLSLMDPASTVPR